MQQRISPARSIAGSIRLPGDKSLSHRYAIIGSIAGGVTRIRNYSTGADCASTLAAVHALGAKVDRSTEEVRIHGSGLGGLRAPDGTLDAGNSGSTIRMLTGVLAGRAFQSRVDGDESLRRRPMARVIKPLEQMGASIDAREGEYPPLVIRGRPLGAIDYTMPVASAQVKSAILLAGLDAAGTTTVREPAPTRDHTEIALREFGADIQVRGRAISVSGGARLEARAVSVPGDLSSAAFFLVAALIVTDSDLIIRDVGLNPSRSALVDFLVSIGAHLRILDVAQSAGELRGDLRVRRSEVRGGVIEGDTTAALIDEIPVLAVLGAASADGLTVRNAGELRLKETDRISTVADNLRRMGIAIETTDDGFHVPGRQRFHAAQLESHGDHRIAMAFAVAALVADDVSIIDGAEAASVSFPEFYQILASVAA